MIHGHVTAWVLALILFFVAMALQSSGKEKGAKIVKMILRVLYLLIIATGVGLIFSLAKISVLYILKAVVGLWIIGLFEMILGRVASKRRTSVFWIQFVIAWALVLYLGFIQLPMSIMNP
ncbi:YisL family protein [Neobacillus niacini]|uniref:YisL family protein n=1 Tax=Neobacillus niacini TaxID=86668 RepID=UPI0021CAE3A6|nr:YisL family protein [Neobacillus niacini]MCM3767400.1 YisL family protein [Neobacillus niacini]